MTGDEQISDRQKIPPFSWLSSTIGLWVHAKKGFMGLQRDVQIQTVDKRQAPVSL
jgi:hypothetical protein